MSTNYIKSIGTGGQPDGGVYAVSPDGNLAGVKLVPIKQPDGSYVQGLKPGWRAATAADLEAAAKAAAALNAADKKQQAPAGGPLKKGG